MNVLVTGGAGFIGSHLVDRLIAGRHRVVVVDDLSTGRRSNVNPRARFVKMDVRSPRLGRVFAAYRPDAVLHLAAQKNVRTSVENPKFDADINVMGSLNVIERAGKTRVRTFVFASSAAVYADATRIPIAESSRCAPVTPYGIAKYAVEQYLDVYGRQYGMRTVSLRFANVYGPRQDAKGEAGVVAIFARRLLRGLPLVVNGSGQQTRDFIYVGDVVSANLAALGSTVRGAFNIGTGTQTSVNALAREILAASGSSVAVRHGPRVKGEVQRSCLAWRRAGNAFRWKPAVKLRDGVRSTVVWFSEASK